MSLTYTPVPSVVPFLLSDAFQSFIVGPVGSTKTTAALMKIVMEAKRVAPCTDGVRRSRYAVVRNTNQMLKDSTIADWLKLFPNGQAGVYETTNMKFTLRLDDVETEILFRGLDDTQDVRRLLSLQLTGAMLDEVREINPDVFKALTGRLGRYPNGMMVPHRSEWGVDDKGHPVQGCVDDQGKTMKRLWGATNPADYDSFWEEYLSNPPANCHVTIQPSGMSPGADWLQHLPSNYYEDMMQGKDQDWIDVYIHGKWGASLAGKPVFRCFDRSTHVAASPLMLVPSPLVIGADAGLNPTAVLTQLTYDGRVAVHDAVTGHTAGMGALRFIREVLKPLLNNDYRAVQSVAVVVDPAANQRSQSDEKTVFDIYKQEGFAVQYAPTNVITARLAAVENYLTRTINGNPGMIISPKASLIIGGLSGKYRYKINTKGVTDDKPEKLHPISDAMDALQYACLHHDGGKIFGRQMGRRRVVNRADTSAWT